MHKGFEEHTICYGREIRQILGNRREYCAVKGYKSYKGYIEYVTNQKYNAINYRLNVKAFIKFQRVLQIFLM